MYRLYPTPRTALKLVLPLILLALCAPPLQAQRFVKVVDTVQDLARVNINDVHTNVFVADSLRGGLFVPATRTTTNSGTAFASTNALKQWNRQFSGPMHVTWFGADPRGVVDATTAMQAAVTAAAGTNNAIYIPPGSYKVGVIDLSGKTNLHVKSERAVLVRNGTDNNGVFHIDGTHNANITIEGIVFDLQWAQYATQTVNSAVFARRSTGIKIKDCEVVRSTENGFKFRNSSDIELDHVKIDSVGNVGIEFNFTEGDGHTGSATVPTKGYFKVRDSWIGNTDDGRLGSGDSCGILVVANTTISNTVITECLFERNTFTNNVRHIWLEVSNDVLTKMVNIKDNVGDRAKQLDAGVIGSKQVNISGNTFRNAGTQSTTTSNSQASIYIGGNPGTTSEQVNIHDNNILEERNDTSNFTLYGILVAKADRLSIKNNTIVGPNGIQLQNVLGSAELIGNKILGTSIPTATNGINFGTGNTATWEIWGNNVLNFLDTWVNEPGAVNEATGLVDEQFYLPGNVQIMDDGRSIGPWGSPSNNWNFTIRGGNNVDPAVGGYITLYGINSATPGRVMVTAGTGGTPSVIDTGAFGINTGGGDRWMIDTNGFLEAYTDNVYDIGNNGAHRPRTIYAGTSMISPIVVVNDNPYNATTWNSSFIVPTENAVRDEIESLRAAKQNAFTTAIGVTNIANVLSAVVNAGTNVVLTTNGNAIVINADASGIDTDTDGYIELPTVTTSDGMATPIFTNTPAINTMTAIHADIYAITDGFGDAAVRSVNVLFLNDGGAFSATISDMTSNEANLGTDSPAYTVTASIIGGTTGKVFVTGVIATNVKWKMRYRLQTHTF